MQPDAVLLNQNLQKHVETDEMMRSVEVEETEFQSVAEDHEELKAGETLIPIDSNEAHTPSLETHKLQNMESAGGFFMPDDDDEYEPSDSDENKSDRDQSFACGGGAVMNEDSLYTPERTLPDTTTDTDNLLIKLQHSLGSDCETNSYVDVSLQLQHSDGDELGGGAIKVTSAKVPAIPPIQIADGSPKTGNGGCIRLYEQRFDDEVKPRWVYQTREGQVHKYPAEFEIMLETIYFSTSKFKCQPFVDHTSRDVLVDVWKMTHTYIDDGTFLKVRRVCTEDEAEKIDEVTTPKLITSVEKETDVEEAKREIQETEDIRGRIKSDLILKAGWLHKKIGWYKLSVYQKRWCVLSHEGSFGWFKNQNRTLPERQIQCAEINKVQQTGNYFRIEKEKMKLFFRHEEESEIKSWVDAIHVVKNGLLD